MGPIRTEKSVKDLKIGDVLCGQGVVRSVVPAPGGRVYVLLEKLILDTTTFGPEARVCIELANKEVLDRMEEARTGE